MINPTIQKIKIILSDKSIEFETPLVLALNSISVAGIPFNKEGHLNDGKFDIVVVKNGPYKGLFNIIRLFLLGLVRLRRKHSIYHFRFILFNCYRR